MMIIVCGLNAVQGLVDTHSVGRVVSLLGPETPHHNFKGIARDQHLKLTFHDVVEMMDGFSAPRATDAEKLIEFIEGWDRANPHSALACTHREIDDRRDVVVAHNTLPCHSRVWLFNPRTQTWFEHFHWSTDGLQILGLTPIGHATV